MSNYLLKWINFWPPLLFAGIKVTYQSNDFREIDVRLKLRFWNTNYVGTQYGGSMFSLTDPFYMLMLMQNLGKEYTIWDKAASIRFLKPGRTHLTAKFTLSEEDIKAIQAEVKEKGRMEWKRTVQIYNLSSECIAEVERVISIKN